MNCFYNFFNELVINTLDLIFIQNSGYILIRNTLISGIFSSNEVVSNFITLPRKTQNTDSVNYTAKESKKQQETC